MRPPLILLEWGWRRWPEGKFSRKLLDLHHLEILLARAALGAGPVHRHVFPARAGLDAFVGQPRRLVVDEAADEAHPRLELDLAFAHVGAGSAGIASAGSVTHVVRISARRSAGRSRFRRHR